MFSGAHRASAVGDDVDFYPTQPWGMRTGGELIRRFDPAARTAYECACGAGHGVHALTDYFDQVFASDVCLYDRNRVHDFLGAEPSPFTADWIVTNPPFSNAAGFITRAWAEARRGVAMLMPARTLETIGRHELFFGMAGAVPPLTVFAPFSERLPMHRGVYDPDRGTAANYAWFLFLKPVLRPRRFLARVPDVLPAVVGPSGPPDPTRAERGGWVYRPAVVDIPPGTKARLFRRSDLAFAVDGAARMVMARLRAEGSILTPARIRLLAAVASAGGTRGVTPLYGTFDAGLLATLKGMGLLEHAPEIKGDLGDRRFRPSADGRAVLAEWGGGV